MGLPWEALLDDCDRRLRGSDIRDLLRVTAQPDVISFAGGLPAPEFFPVEAMREAFDAVLRSDGVAALQYGPTEGYEPLKEYLSQYLATRGIVAAPDEILTTTGPQQGLDLLSKVLLRPGSRVVVEAPSYVGALQAWMAHDPCFIAVPMDEQGLRVDDAAAVLREAPAEGGLLYTAATFQNPSGVTMSAERRRALLDLCLAHNLPLIEDDPYGELRYEGERVPSFRALPGGGDAIYLGTFSKTLAPGLRVGWVVAPRPLIKRLVIAKQAADLHTDSLVQRAVLHYCRHADLDGHVARLRAVYGARRDAMLAALERYAPEGVTWTRPQGGLFLWLRLPQGTDAREVLKDALAQRVAFVPGTAFHPHGEGANCLRRNFSHSDEARIEEGVRRLAGVLAAHLRQAAPV